MYCIPLYCIPWVHIAFLGRKSLVRADGSGNRSKWRPYCILGSTLTVFWSLSLQLKIKKTTYRWFRNIYIADLASNRVLMRHRSSRNTTKIEPARHLPNRFNFDYFFSTVQNLSKRKFAAVFGVSWEFNMYTGEIQPKKKEGEKI